RHQRRAVKHRYPRLAASLPSCLRIHLQLSSPVPIPHPVFLFFAAFIAGILNAVAGGGSFISFPALLFTGMAPIAANATSTAAVWPGTVASTVAYRNAFTPAARRLLPALLFIGIIGGFLGARILLSTPQSTFMRLVPWLLLAATLLFLAGPRISAWVKQRAAQGKTSRPLFIAGIFLELLISMYIGYFGAGVGILVLSLLALLGMEDIHAMNGVKVLLVSVVNGVAMATFIVAGIIVWPQAILMLVGSLIGGYGGAYYAQKINPQHVRWIVIAVGFAMSAYFFIHR
ncbi:MAG: sulfite exporter TauE/SafE family protein, partial [Candidatus Acidiferrales bacterium]